MAKQKDTNGYFDRASRRAAALRVGKEGMFSKTGHGATMLGALIREAISPTDPPSREEIQRAHVSAVKDKKVKKAAGKKKAMEETAPTREAITRSTPLAKRISTGLEGVKKKAKKSTGY